MTICAYNVNLGREILTLGIMVWSAISYNSSLPLNSACPEHCSTCFTAIHMRERQYAAPVDNAYQHDSYAI